MSKCQVCGSNIPICFNVLLCDPCLEKQIKVCNENKNRVKLGEIDPNLEGVPAVVELEFIWNLK